MRSRLQTFVWMSLVFCHFTIGCTNIFYPFTKPVTPPPSVPMSYLAYGYVSTYANQVEAYNITSSGLWTPSKNGQVNTGGEPVAIAVDPSNRFLYAANSLDNDISQYVIDPATGVPHINQPATVSTGGSRPQNVTIDHSGRFLYVPTGGNIRMYEIDQASGRLLPTSPATVKAAGANGESADSAVIDPSNRYIYANTGADVLIFTLDSISGLLTRVGGILYNGTGRGFTPVIDPKDRFLYLVDENTDVLRMFAIDGSTGLLTAATPATEPVGNGPSSLDIDPMGRYLYVENRSEDTISQFNVQADGSVIPMKPAKVQQGGYRIIVDPSGQLAYVGADGVIIYRINTTGGLEYYNTANSGSGIGIAVARHQ